MACQRQILKNDPGKAQAARKFDQKSFERRLRHLFEDFRITFTMRVGSRQMSTPRGFCRIVKSTPKQHIYILQVQGGYRENPRTNDSSNV